MLCFSVVVVVVPVVPALICVALLHCCSCCFNVVSNVVVVIMVKRVTNKQLCSVADIGQGFLYRCFFLAFYFAILCNLHSEHDDILERYTF